MEGRTERNWIDDQIKISMKKYDCQPIDTSKARRFEHR